MQKPWIAHYDPKMKESVNYPEKSMYEMLVRTAKTFPDRVAIRFEGSATTYKETLSQVRTVSERLRGLGFQKGDVLTICLPNIPQAVIVFYAANRLGVIANMVHPKTPPDELSEFMTSTGSRYLIILDAFMFKSLSVFEKSTLKRSSSHGSGFSQSAERGGFFIMKGRKIPPIPVHERFVTWRELIAGEKNCSGMEETAERERGDRAARSGCLPA